MLLKKKYPTPIEVIDGQSLASRDIIEENQFFEIVLRDQISKIVFNVIQYQTNSVEFASTAFDSLLFDRRCVLSSISRSTPL